MNMGKIRTYLPCPKCERQMPTIIKMGGLICEACRIIIAGACSKEWNQAIDLDYQQEFGSNEKESED